MRDQTFITIHNLTPDANILFASASVENILGYNTLEVRGRSCWDYFHPDEVPFARSVHSRGVLLDKAAVLHYARIRGKDGSWVNCECCFTVVYDVLVACISRYLGGPQNHRRAMEAPQIRRIFSSSPRDPRYHMLEHLSPKFRMTPVEREPRAALLLSRFSINLPVIFATDAIELILGLKPGEILEKPFYDCIQQNCLPDAIECLESAKSNESIAYLRFWYRDPRTADAGDDVDDDADSSSSSSRSRSSSSSNSNNSSSNSDSEGGGARLNTHMDIDDDEAVKIEAPSTYDTENPPRL
ncbi:hypothetical protein P8C59_001427 [Phyllachora maydis]|uniref:PAS domain-containing protein n=1 Tax=Phyllachora maydis TaxID=1825666 RepID=A0AAD9HY57_9PEZI|nr:hypothetical protein P8C59_001427 [Phyllachora maydis]